MSTLNVPRMELVKCGQYLLRDPKNFTGDMETSREGFPSIRLKTLFLHRPELDRGPFKKVSMECKVLPHLFKNTSMFPER